MLEQLAQAFKLFQSLSFDSCTCRATRMFSKHFYYYLKILFVSSLIHLATDTWKAALRLISVIERLLLLIESNHT